jgi:hypothetical protein
MMDMSGNGARHRSDGRRWPLTACGPAPNGLEYPPCGRGPVADQPPAPYRGGGLRDPGRHVEAVRGRIKRGTLEHERDSGTVYVWLDIDQSPTSDQPDDDQLTGQPQPDVDEELADELRSRIRYLESARWKRSGRREGGRIRSSHSSCRGSRSWRHLANAQRGENPPRALSLPVYHLYHYRGRRRSSGGRTVPLVA